jgi:hypothetical protein
MKATLAPRTRRLLSAAAGTVLCLGLLPAAGQASPADSGPAARPSANGTTHGEQPGSYDARNDPSIRSALTARSSLLAARPSTGVSTLRSQLGVQGIVDIDPLTSTPRQVARLDGFLTGASAKSPTQIALGYLAAHTDVFGLGASQISALRLRKDYVDVAGTHHLSYLQQVGGVPVFGNGLKADVARDGRLIQINGSPVAQLPPAMGAARLTAVQARDAAVRDVFGSSKTTVQVQRADAVLSTEFASGDRAQLVVFQTAGGPRLAWQTITMREGYIHVVDAASGRILFRQSLAAKDNGTAWTNYPGAPGSGGTQQSHSFSNWLPNKSPILSGNSSHVFLDLNDNDIADPGEDVGPSSPGHFTYPFTDFTAQVGPPCAAVFKCSWNPAVRLSWQTNAKQNATQLFFFTSNFHDHLAATPIGFTRAAGNFERADGDAVQVNAMDGANIADGLPDANHVDNANMSTPPDGMSPRMQMYLFPNPTDPTDPFLAGNSGDEADVVYHEYTHGLSNRLVVDAAGVSTLGNIQAGSMGEAWSDWYAFDYLVSKSLVKDTNAPGEVRVGQYVGAGQDLIRTQPLDCPVGTTAAACPGTPGAGPGGYTYGDFGRIIGSPEVHADGEIWGETLWDLRKALGSTLAESLVTRAMELSPANPSFLDMRNSILQADLVVDKARKQQQIWKTFAARGMGWFAGSVDGDDTQPAEDFSMPPAANTPRGSLTGKVTNTDTGAPVPGAVVAFGGHNSGFAGDYAAVTDTNGSYTISGIIPGTYPKVFARSAGYDPVSQTVSVAAHATALNWSVRRDWASIGGGSSVVDFNGPDFSDFGCGPSALFDQSQGSGWGSDAVLTSGTAIEPRFVVVKLPSAVSVKELSINPSNTCGDGGSASAGDYRVETSADGTTWTVAASGHFGVGNRNKMNSVPLSAGTTTGVQFVRYTILGTQVADAGGTCPGAFSGCQFVDSVELAVYGSPN